ncbi:MAG: molybdopterin-guanine dinucleotide biosynthesis protein B [Deltaproteobacteria bacterium]|nr:molybdopterin-guanine dinucleotide biosynthesis protein B [Deltaproteobacteria bacterium]
MAEKIPIVTFIGKSNSGKTTLLVKIIPELKKRGYRIATIKHSHHNVNIDKKGKDSWKHKEAGSETVILMSGKTVSMVREYEEEPQVEFIRDRFIDSVDIVLAEGFKWTDVPKIWVFRKENSSTIIRKDESLIAVVSDDETDLGVPWIHIDDISKVADFVEEKFLKR